MLRIRGSEGCLLKPKRLCSHRRGISRSLPLLALCREHVDVLAVRKNLRWPVVGLVHGIDALCKRPNARVFCLRQKMDKTVVLSLVEAANAAGGSDKRLADVRGVAKWRPLSQVSEAAQADGEAAKKVAVERLPVARLHGIKARIVGLAALNALLPDVLGL